MDNQSKEKNVAEKMFEPSDYEKEEQLSRGMAITHEQVSDTLTEGTIDGEIDRVGEDGQLISDKGTDLQKRKQYAKKK